MAAKVWRGGRGGLKRARKLRGSSTDAEARLWSRLRDRQIGGAKFRLQAPTGPYVVDFFCVEKRHVIEVDGGQHGKSLEKDARRDTWLGHNGYRVLRFWNNEVLNNTEGVLEKILRVVRGEE